MKRKYNAQMAMSAIELLRENIPNVKFTTDIIVGFPGESEETFLETEAFAREAGFLMMHVFPYSKRSGTPAAEMSGQLDNSVKKSRVARLGAVGKEIRSGLLDRALERSDAVEVLFEDYKDGYAYGHTDNFFEVRVKSDRPLRSEFHKVRFISHDGETLDADLISE